MFLYKTLINFTDFLDKYKKIYEKNNYKIKKIFFVYIIVLVFILMYALNLKTSLIADDFWYSFSFGKWTPIKNFSDIIKSQAHHYKIWGGRSVVHTVAQIFLFKGKGLFNIINTFAYIVFTMLIYAHSNAYKKLRPSLYIIINLLIWFFIPAFAETLLWLVGSANYLWGTILCLIMLLPYRLYLYNPQRFKDGALSQIAIFIFGILSGWTNENTAAAMIVMIFLFMILYRINKIDVKKLHIAGLVGSIIGYMIMMLAPGNYERAALHKDNRPILKALFIHLKDVIKTSLKYMFPLFIILIILSCLFIYLSKNHTEAIFSCIIYFIGSLIAIFLMVIPYACPDRALFGAISYIIISVGILYSETPSHNSLIRNLSVSLITVICVPFLISYINGYSDNLRTYNEYKKREVYIDNQKNSGNYDIRVELISSNSRYNVYSSLEDVNPDKEHWVNIGAEKYYGLKSIYRNE